MEPGDYLSITEETLLVHGYESVLGNMVKMGSDETQIGFMFVFKGQMNNSGGKEGEMTVMLPVEGAFNLMNDILSGLEVLQKRSEEN
jgi:hypothetical protein